MKTILALLFISYTASAQYTAVAETFSDISGRPFFPTQYQNVNGSPYFFQDWVLSEIALTNGNVLKDIRANINLATDEVHFLNEDGSTMIANSAVIRSVETSAPDHYKFVPSPAQNAFFLLLVDGKARLLKQQKKTIMETKPFNSATIERTFVQDTRILLEFNGDLREVKSTSDIYRLLSPGGELERFGSSRKLKKKSLDSWITLVEHFNSGK